MDHNGSYVSAKNCAYYNKFPTHIGIAIKGEPRYDGGLKPAFMVLEEIEFTDLQLERAVSMLFNVSKLEVITEPMYNFLLDHNTHMKVTETIYPSSKILI